MENPTNYFSFEWLLGSGVVAKVVSCMIIALVGLIVLKIFSGWVKGRIARGKKQEAMNFIYRSGKALIICLTVVIMLMQFEMFSSAMVSLLAGSGVVAVVAGFASQDALGTRAAGAMLMLTHPFEVGDWIRIPDKGIDGFVETMTIRHTIVRTLTNTRMVIPNSTMNTLVIENLNMTDEKVVNLLEIGVSYNSDIELARRIMAEEVEKHPAFVDTRSEEDKAAGVPAVNVICISLADSSVTLRAPFTSPDAGSGFGALSDLRISVKKRFDEAGVSIPFPQRVVHIAKD